MLTALLDIHKLEAIHRLWDELSAFPPGQTERAAKHLMDTLGKLFDSDHGIWFGLVDGVPGLESFVMVEGMSPAAMMQLQHRENFDKAFRKAMRMLRRGERLESPLMLSATGRGDFRARRVRELVPEAFLESAYYRETYLASGASDAIFINFPVVDGAESCFSFTRPLGGQPFSEADRHGLAYAVRGLRWFHRRVLLHYGLYGNRAPLTPAERRVLSLLLEGAADKDVALCLDLGLHTTRAHAASLYRKYGVSGRAELLSMWISG